MSDTEKESQPGSKQVAIYYEKSPQFRTVHATGAWAGVSPQAEIQLTFFTDLLPTPDVVVHQVTPEGGLGEEIERAVRGGIVRECEVSVILSQPNAEKLIDLLQQVLEQFKEILEEKTKGGEGE